MKITVCERDEVIISIVLFLFIGLAFIATMSVLFPDPDEIGRINLLISIGIIFIASFFRIGKEVSG